MDAKQARGMSLRLRRTATWASTALVVAWMCVLGMGCQVTSNNVEQGDALAKLAKVLAEHGLKAKNVVVSSTATAAGTASGSGVSLSGSGGAMVTVTNTITFDTVPLKDPAISAKLGVQDTGNTAVRALSFTMNGAPVSVIGDPAAATQLASQLGRRWQVFSLAKPVTVGARPGMPDAFKLSFRFSQPLPYAPAGSAMPDKLATGLALKLDTMPWLDLRLTDPLKYTPVMVSAAGPQLGHVAPAGTSADPWPVAHGTKLIIRLVTLKSTTATPYDVVLNAAITTGRLTAPAAAVGRARLAAYALQPLKEVAVDTRALAAGTHTLDLSAVAGTARLGNLRVFLRVNP